MLGEESVLHSVSSHSSRKQFRKEYQEIADFDGLIISESEIKRKFPPLDPIKFAANT